MTYKKALRLLAKCNGDCHGCAHLRIPCVVDEATGNGYYCFYCDIHPNLIPRAESIDSVKSEAIATLELELMEVRHSHHD